LTSARRALHRLALRLSRSVEELELLPLQELAEWGALDAPPPPPESLADFRRRFAL